MNLTEEQLMWLHSRGGRTKKDVIIPKSGAYKNIPCVTMTKGTGNKEFVPVENLSRESVAKEFSYEN